MNIQLIQIWKICSPVWMIYFVFWVFTNSILLTSYSIILYHDYLDKRKKIFRKDLQSVLVFRVDDNDDDDDDDMMMNCFCGMVDRRKAFSLISSRDHCQRSSPSRISDTPRAWFEPAQNLSSGLVEWSCAVVITTTTRRHITTTLRFTSLNVLPTCLFSETSLWTL